MTAPEAVPCPHSRQRIQVRADGTRLQVCERCLTVLGSVEGLAQKERETARERVATGVFPFGKDAA